MARRFLIDSDGQEHWDWEFDNDPDGGFYDPVNHPEHYETGNFECIDVMEEVFGTDALKEYCLINAFKYLYRCKRKGKEFEDISKADWYLKKFIELGKER